MSAPSSYDHILYPAHAYKETHPDHLAAIATLYGLTPPDVRKCRVLEIGCGDGSNLIPMAVGLPSSSFTGVELAGQPVETANKTIEASGLKNVRVLRMNLLDITTHFGTFDYILAHGVYSWVPENVREHLLRVCSDNLNANGLAFISYNTFPAGHLREASREMVRFHLGSAFEGTDVVGQGKAFLKLMADTVEGQDLWSAILRSESQRFSMRDDRVTYHDEFGSSYTPVYFYHFAREIEDKGLRFVSEAQTKDALQPPVNRDVLRTVETLAAGDFIRFQQYLDLLSFNGFRGSLLCKSHAEVERENFYFQINRLSLASALTRVQKHKDGSVEYKHRRGPGTITTNNLRIIAALKCLEEKWPQSVGYEVLLEAGLNRSTTSSVENNIFAEGILKLAANSLVDLRSQKLLLPDAVSLMPTGSPLARLQAAQGKLVTTLLHTHVDIPDPNVRRVLQLLDGTRDVATLARGFQGDYPASSRSAIESQLKSMIENFRQMGLLIA